MLRRKTSLPRAPAVAEEKPMKPSKIQWKFFWLPCSLVFLFIFFQYSNNGKQSSIVNMDSTAPIPLPILRSKEKAISSCLERLQSDGLFDADEIEEVGTKFYCLPGNKDLLEFAIADRIKLRTLERRDFLHNLRSYRMSGLVCNDHLDKTIPAVDTEEAFRCLPMMYQKQACMNGLTAFPKSCSVYRMKGESAEEALQRQGGSPYEVNSHNHVDCDAPKSACSAFFAGNGASVTAGQLSPNMTEAKVLKIRSDNRPVWTIKVMDYINERIKNGQDVSPLDYPGSHQAMERAMRVVDLHQKRVLVFGSISPWVEALALRLGASHPTLTVDYNPPISTDPRLDVKLMSTLLEEFTTWPIIVSYSSIEHDGQGRYGDPLDPNGDLAAMQEAWLKLSPGGIFILGVPFSDQDQFHWYSQRLYGPARLPVLTHGWEYVGLATSEKAYKADETFALSDVKDKSPVLLLRKPESAGPSIHGPQSWNDTLICSHDGKCRKGVTL